MTFTESRIPGHVFWLPNGCPEWCDWMDTHKDSDGPEDRSHLGGEIKVPLSLEDAVDHGSPGWEPDRIVASLRKMETDSEASVEITRHESAVFATMTLAEATQFAAAILDVVEAARTNSAVAS